MMLYYSFGHSAENVQNKTLFAIQPAVKQMQIHHVFLPGGKKGKHFLLRGML